jgi:two-component system, NarL family, invasion response regulator UvrY
MTGTNKVKVALVDDHNLLREALAQVINNMPGYQTSISVANGRQLVEAIGGGPPPGLVITDFAMPEMDGYGVTEYIKKHYPHTPVLLLTMYDSEVILIKLMQAGASGFLKKDMHPADLKRALDETMATGYYYAGNTAARLAGLFKKNGDGPSRLDSNVFTEQELQFMQLSATDLTYKQISEDMKLALHQTNHLREALFLKAGVSSRVGLILFAVKHGIVRITGEGGR